MTPEQIKQTVAEIREISGLRSEINKTKTAEDCLKLLAVIDHLQKTIEAQAAEIERLTKERDEARGQAFHFRMRFGDELPMETKYLKSNYPLPWEKQ